MRGVERVLLPLGLISMACFMFFLGWEIAGSVMLITGITMLPTS